MLSSSDDLIVPKKKIVTQTSISTCPCFPHWWLGASALGLGQLINELPLIFLRLFRAESLSWQLSSLCQCPCTRQGISIIQFLVLSSSGPHQLAIPDIVVPCGLKALTLWLPPPVCNNTRFPLWPVIVITSSIVDVALIMVYHGRRTAVPPAVTILGRYMRRGYAKRGI